MEPVSFTLSQIYAALAIVGLIGALVSAGYIRYLLSVKQGLEQEDRRLKDNIKKLWAKMDERVDESDRIEKDLGRELHKLELDAISRFATKNELAEAIAKFERSVEKLRDHIDDKHSEIMKRLSEVPNG